MDFDILGEQYHQLLAPDTFSQHAGYRIHRNQMIKVFLSHSRKDKGFVKRLASDLETQGFKVWLDEVEILVGDSIVTRIAKGLQDSDYVAVVLTESSAASGWVEKEWQSHIGREAESRGVSILPLLVDDCDIPFLLNEKLYADFRRDYEIGFNQLTSALNGQASRKIVPENSSRAPATHRKIPHDADENSPNKMGELANYAVGEIPLPFRTISVRLLSDSVTAVVGGSNGQLAAVDLTSGKITDVVQAHDQKECTNRVGGGEVSYRGHVFFFLEKVAADHLRCLTMSHSGILKIWVIEEGRLKKWHEVDLLQPHRSTLHSSIVHKSKRGSWSSWSCYNQGIPEGAPEGLISAKLTLDGRHLLCLTSWFAIYRCDLAGRMVDGPKVVSDTFAIEPASLDGSSFFAGRSRSSRGQGDSVQHYDFSSEESHAAASNLGAIGMRGIHAISDEMIYAGNRLLSRPSLKRTEPDVFSMGIGCRPSVCKAARLVAVPQRSSISVHNLDSLGIDNKPLVAGHKEGDVLDIDISSDGTVLVSTSHGSLRVWNLSSRLPFGGYPSNDRVLRHSLSLLHNGAIASNKFMFSPAYNQASVPRRCSLIVLREGVG